MSKFTTTGLFLDSGAFSLKRKRLSEIEYKAYLDRYAKFVSEHSLVLDYYANVDVIGDAAQTWKNQEYLEKEHGLRPTPVIHLGESLEWLGRYLDSGYGLIAFGGLVGTYNFIASSGAIERGRWLDRAFKEAGSTRIHGFGITFGVTNFRVLQNRPWWSVDNTTWVKESAYGGIFMPGRLKGSFSYQIPPHIIKVTDRLAQSNRLHSSSMKQQELIVLQEWLELIGSTMEEVRSSSKAREQACIAYFEKMRMARSLGELKIFYSGADKSKWPMSGLKPVAVMITFADKSACRLIHQVDNSHEVAG